MPDLRTDRGTVVGIGRVKIPRMPKHGFDYEVPVFCYIAVKSAHDEPTTVEWDGGNYIATCINLRIDGYGNTCEEAERNMARNVFEYVHKIFRHNESNAYAAWDNILSLWLSNGRSSQLWDAFNTAQIELAKTGRSLDSSTAQSKAYEKIIELEKKVRELEELLGINPGSGGEETETASIAGAIAEPMIVQEGKLAA
jgi:hypothetical protein